MGHMWKFTTAILFYCCMLHHSECETGCNGNFSVVVLPPCNISRENNAYIKRPIKIQYTPLQDAALRGLESVVQNLISEGHSVNERNQRGDTALHLAISAGYPNVARILIRNGAGVNIRGHNLTTPLILAAAKGDETLVQTLLQQGANAMAYDINEDRALLVAVRGGFLNVVTLLRDLNLYGGREEVLHQAIIEAFDKKRIDILNKLAIVPINKNTMKECIIKIWNEKSFWFLVDNSAENLINTLHDALVSIVKDGRCNEMKIIKAAATLHQETLNEALYHSASLGFGDCVKDLVAAGANVNTKIQLYTPLYGAANFGNIENMKILLDAGADPNIYTRWGDTPLVPAVRKDCFDCVQLLLSYGANPKLAQPSELPLYQMASSLKIKNILLEYERKT